MPKVIKLSNDEIKKLLEGGKITKSLPTFSNDHLKRINIEIVKE